MSTRIEIEVTGPQTAAVMAVLAARLAELGYTAACAGAGVAMETLEGAVPPETPLAYEVSPHDPPEFAAEKILDELAAAGLVKLDDASMSAADEAEMQDRLRRLGYIE